MQREARVFSVRRKGDAPAHRVREADCVRHDLEDVHGQGYALCTARVHNFVNLWELDDAPKDDDAEAERLAQAQAQARQVGQVGIPNERRVAVLRQVRSMRARTSPRM